MNKIRMWLRGLFFGAANVAPVANVPTVITVATMATMATVALLVGAVAMVVSSLLPIQQAPASKPLLLTQHSHSFRMQLQTFLDTTQHQALLWIDSIALSYKHTTPNVALLQKVLYHDLQLQFSPDAHIPANTWPAGVLQQKKASCLGIGIIALLLAEKWQMPLSGVAAPQHFFLRYQDSINFEPNRQGYAHSNEYYAQNYTIDSSSSVYLRSLTIQEVMGILYYMKGLFLQNTITQNNSTPVITSAMQSYSKALAYFPTYPEALGNYAVLLAQQGHLDSAHTILTQMQTIVPNDPLVTKNLQRIEQLAHPLPNNTH
jgi:regulator of sirC expression with transglutaminase-like and TPR domain